MKRCLLFTLVLSGPIAACSVFGCACTDCRGDEARPSPQSQPQSPGWRDVDRGEPVPAPPAPSPRVPPHDFANPPTDEPTAPPVPVTTPPSPPPAPPAPAPVAPLPVGPSEEKVTTTRTEERKGGLVISGNTGTIFLNSPGAAVPAAAPPQSPQPAQAFPAVPILTAVASNPQVVSVVGATLKRIGGGLSYMATGLCPTRTAAPAAAAPMYALQPVTSYQAVPLQMAPAAAWQPIALAPAAAPTHALPVAAPQYVPAPQQYVAASPQFAVAAPTPARKCRFFGP